MKETTNSYTELETNLEKSVNDYEEIKCPECNKILLSLICTHETTLKMWCKRCKEEKVVITK